MSRTRVDRSDGAASEASRCGNCAIKPAAILAASNFVKNKSGSAASSVANFWAATSTGRPARRAASCQGSRFMRPSNDTMLSGNPFRSSPIAANRKASNSDPRRELEPTGFMISRSFVGRAVARGADEDPLRARMRNLRPRGIRERLLPRRAEHQQSLLPRHTGSFSESRGPSVVELSLIGRCAGGPSGAYGA